MDLDLSNLSWEQKALIGIGAIVLIILIYAYVPWGLGNETVIDTNNTTVVDTAPPSSNNPKYSPVSQETQNINESNNTNTQLDTNTDTNSSDSNNGTNQQENKQITSIEAKEIAAQGGLTAGSPRSGTFKKGNENVPVWIVPLSENHIVVKEVYIDKSTGEILDTHDLNTASQDTGNITGT